MPVIDRPNPVLNPTYSAADELVAREIVRDLSDRRGLRHEWEQIDEDVQEEIVATWAQIVANGRGV